MVLSRISAAPNARLGLLAFECQETFPSQCWMLMTRVIKAVDLLEDGRLRLRRHSSYLFRSSTPWTRAHARSSGSRGSSIGCNGRCGRCNLVVGIAGQTLSEIGRALNKHAGSVHGVLAVTGGIEPHPYEIRQFFLCPWFISFATHYAIEGAAPNRGRSRES